MHCDLSYRISSKLWVPGETCVVILESSILFQGETLLEVLFYSERSTKFIEKSARNALLQAVVSLSENAFNDEIENFSVGDYSIIMISEKITDLSENGKVVPIYLYCISQNGTNKVKLKSLMHEAISQFLNRFSLFDIMRKNKEIFSEFIERFEKIFADLTQIPEDYSHLEKEIKKANYDPHSTQNSYSFRSQF